MLRATLAAATALLAAAPSAWALLPAYKPDRMQALQAQDRVVVVYFTSQTCSLCGQQEETLDRLARGGDDLAAPAFLEADFDSAADLRQLWQVTAPSTLVVFRGTQLLARSTGLVSEDDIRAFVRDAVVHSWGRPGPRIPRAVTPKR